jgi:ABC-type molybdate transport system substrate-binding protein
LAKYQKILRHFSLAQAKLTNAIKENKMLQKVKQVIASLVITFGATNAFSAPTECGIVPQTSATYDYTIGVASNMWRPMTDPDNGIVAKYLISSPTPPVTAIRVCHNSTAVLEDEIVNQNNPYNYVLFLAANTAAPDDLEKNHASLVIGNDFNYTIGIPVLYSAQPDSVIRVSSSGGWVNDANNSTITSLAVANPAAAPYGAAALAILQNPLQYQYTQDVIDKIGTYYDNIDLTYQAVLNGEKDAGFVAGSQICNNGSLAGNYYQYDPQFNIRQAGIVINETGYTLVQPFVTWLLASGGQNSLAYFCYARLSR